MNTWSNHRVAGGGLLVAAVLAGLALLSASAPAGAQTLTWPVVPIPSPAVGDYLYRVSRVPATACTARIRTTARPGG